MKPLDPDKTTPQDEVILPLHSALEKVQHAFDRALAQDNEHTADLIAELIGSLEDTIDLIRRSKFLDRTPITARPIE